MKFGLDHEQRTEKWPQLSQFRCGTNSPPGQSRKLLSDCWQCTFCMTSHDVTDVCGVTSRPLPESLARSCNLAQKLPFHSTFHHYRWVIHSKGLQRHLRLTRQWRGEGESHLKAWNGLSRDDEASVSTSDMGFNCICDTILLLTTS